MTRWLKAAGFLVLILAIPVSCRQLFTTSLFSGAARTGSLVSSSMSTSDLLTLANADTTDKDVAADILSALAGKDLSNLSTEDKTTILNLATTATTSIATITDLASKATSGSTSTEDLVSEVLGTFDSSVDLTAVTTILAGDTSDIPVDTIVLASAAVVADVADEAGTDTTLNVLATGDTSSLTTEQQTKIDLIIDVKNELQSDRATELDSTSISGFNLGDLLSGSAS